MCVVVLCISVCIALLSVVLRCLIGVCVLVFVYCVLCDVLSMCVLIVRLVLVGFLVCFMMLLTCVLCVL